MRRIRALIMVSLIVFSVTGCKSQEVRNVEKQIETIGEINENTGDKLIAIENDYNLLSDDEKADVKNYSIYEDAWDNYSTMMYGNIAKCIQEAESLSKDYFAQYFDLGKVEIAKENAEQVLEISNTKEYKTVYDNIKNISDSLRSYLDSEKDKIFNKQSNVEEGTEFPFAVNDDILASLDMQPVIKQNSNHPTWVVTVESDVTDKPSHVVLFGAGGVESSYDYYYEVNNIPTKEIKVQNESGEIQSALVNTEIHFKLQDNFSYGRGDAAVQLNERPCYLLVGKDNGIIYLALQSYDGEDYYILYA